MDSQELLRQEQKLRQILAELPQQKWEVLKYAVGGIIFSFISPVLMDARSNMDLTSEENYLHAVAVIGIGALAVVALISYYHIKKINYEIYSTQYDVDLLKQKRIELEKAEEDINAVIK